jgi:hypothetical protein
LKFQRLNQKEASMFFAIPIVGKILAGMAAAEASADTSAPQKVSQLKAQASSVGPVDPAAFAQTLNSVDQAAAKSSHNSFSAAKA